MHVLETALIATLQARALGKIEARLPYQECDCPRLRNTPSDRRSKLNGLLNRFGSLIF
jgi:hypothetical protein